MRYNFFTIVNYAWKKVGYTRFLAGFSVLVILWYIVLRPLIEGKTDSLFDFFDPILGFITASLAIAIWYNEMLERWENSLPKKFTAHYVYKKKIAFSALYAYLSNEADIRAFGQHLGGYIVKTKEREDMQKKIDALSDGEDKKNKLIEFEKSKNSPRHLSFFPLIESNVRKLSDDLTYWHYEVYFFLSENELGNDYVKLDCSVLNFDLPSALSILETRPEYSGI